ncbi:MAG TPA: hypothetical protein VMM18_13535 [Gemmatimonadaceae bacterium]|nr:hypothetical protein [Gemmatimonadaceae bacterium]
MRKILATFALTALVFTPTAQAQDVGDIVAYAALVGSPTGGLAPVVTPTMMGAQQTGLGYSFRYGRVTGDNAPNNFGAGISLPVQTLGTIGFTAGYLSPSETGVDGWMMLGANFNRGLMNTAIGAGSSLNVGLDVGLGWGNPEALTLLSGSIGLPVSTVVGQGNWRVVPFVQPGFGYGRASADGASESGTRFLLGAGLGFVDGTRGIGLNIGMQKVFIENGENVIGLGFTWNPRR